jgi:predicted esterase
MFPLQCLTPEQCYLLIAPKEPTEHMIVFLHGLGDSPEYFVQTPVVQTVLEKMQNKEIEPAVIVVPDGRKGYWTDWADGEHPYETHTLEIIRYLQAEQHSNDIALVGVSMGGFGTLSIGLRHPELFSFLVAYSPTDMDIAIQNQPDYPIYKDVFGVGESSDIYLPYALARNPRELILRGAGKDQQLHWIYGDAEAAKFSQGCARLEQTAIAQELEPHVLVVEGGEHSFTTTWTKQSTEWWIEYWQQHVSGN